MKPRDARRAARNCVLVSPLAQTRRQAKAGDKPITRFPGRAIGSRSRPRTPHRHEQFNLRRSAACWFWTLLASGWPGKLTGWRTSPKSAPITSS